MHALLPSACHTVMRDDLSDEGAAGIINRNSFLYWVTEYSCPNLGNVEKGEPRSIVLMDNLSTHMSDKVEDTIVAVGECLIYSPPPHQYDRTIFCNVEISFEKKRRKNKAILVFCAHRSNLMLPIAKWCEILQKCGIP